jgi:hypothetical protein
MTYTAAERRFVLWLHMHLVDSDGPIDPFSRCVMEVAVGSPAREGETVVFRESTGTFHPKSARQDGDIEVGYCVGLMNNPAVIHVLFLCPFPRPDTGSPLPPAGTG